MKFSRSLQTVTYVALALLGLVVAASFLDINRLQPGAVSARIESLRWVLAPVRWSAYGLLLWKWCDFCRWIGHRKKLNEVDIANLCKSRSVIARAVLFVELFINLPTLSVLIDLSR